MFITCSVQLYLPPEYMMNKDFLKEVFAEDKALLRLNQVSRINVPLYDELSVANIWPMMKSDEKFMMYFPTKMAKNRVPDREYMFNILNTIQPNYLQALIKHANDQRNSVSNEAIAREAIEVTDDWWNALNSVPFVSCKYFLSLLQSYTADHSFHTLNFPVQNVKAKRFTC